MRLSSNAKGAVCRRAFLRGDARSAAAAGHITPHFPQQQLIIMLLVLIQILLIPVQQVSPHPQCLDFAPPFKPHWHLEFCRQYEDFGCCDQKTDNAIAERYWDIVDFLEDTPGYELCGDMLKEILCQVNINI